MAGNQFEVILFDLGGVLVELDQRIEHCCWFDNALTDAQNWQRWLTSPLIQRFERGDITPQVFAEKFIQDHQLGVSPDEFLLGFKRWVVGFYPGAIALLEQLTHHYRLAVFSNITAIHWPDLHHELRQSKTISDYFPSYQLGMAKPDPAAFDQVIAQLDVAPNRIFFIDDNAINIQGARSCGITAEVAKGIDQVNTMLQAHDIL